MILKLDCNTIPETTVLRTTGITVPQWKNINKSLKGGKQDWMTIRTEWSKRAGSTF